MKTTYRILRSTKNSGQYAGDQTASLAKAKALVRAERGGETTYWQQEDGDVCAYASREDMSDEDKAIARLRPVSGATK